ncbi:NADPH-dependent FMN reductase [Streptomyces sp. NPDC012751]|uniref:NADPH-dependent FMN reductase n=1 Tax=Streptomyces sp. NPDC012751 TaxID=3364846 RepID=UPI0036B91A0F
MTRILLVSGSLRQGSVNTAVIATVRRILTAHRPAVATADLDLRALPYYDEDVDAVDGSRSVREARALVESADALFISTPSYNGEAPGVLKNALDWLSRPWLDSVLTGKPVAVVTASSGPKAGAEADPGLRSVLKRAGAVLVDHVPVAIGNLEELPPGTPGFTVPSVVAPLESLVTATLAQRAPLLRRRSASPL